MQFFNVDSKDLTRGEVLMPSYASQIKDISKLPILLDGLVYKPFSDKDWQLKLILHLERLALKHLSEIKGLYPKGYVYLYNPDPILTTRIKETIELEQRLTWIHELIKTHFDLKQQGLQYFDYHSDNIIAGQDITLLDLCSMKPPKKQLDEREVEEYLLELIISIFINHNLTTSYSNYNHYKLFSAYFNEPTIMTDDSLDLTRIFNTMASKSLGEVEELRNDVINKK